MLETKYHQASSHFAPHNLQSDPCIISKKTPHSAGSKIPAPQSTPHPQICLFATRAQKSKSLSHLTGAGSISLSFCQLTYFSSHLKKHAAGRKTTNVLHFGRECQFQVQKNGRRLVANERGRALNRQTRAAEQRMQRAHASG
jgi:hypothetical protein